MKVIIALLGKAGAGKDTIATALIGHRPNWNMMVSCTTRPMREGEQEGVNYYYLTNEEFAIKVLNGDMLEAVCFNGWHYGSDKTTLKDGINVGVFNPAGYECLIETAIHDKDVMVLGFYVDVDDKTRLIRQLNRESNPNIREIIRRYQADEADFFDIEEIAKYIVKNETYEDFEDAVNYIQQVVDNLVSLD